MNLRHLAVGLLLMLVGATAQAAEPERLVREPDLVLTGVLRGEAHQTYVEAPFTVPDGVTGLTVDFAYTGKDQKSVIDLGLRDPVRFRGWSGGNKSHFTLSDSAATPSYLPGPLPAGTWRLVLGVPNLRPAARADYVAKIWIDRRDQGLQRLSVAPVRRGSGWYRGDLHMHTGHSDGSCLSQSGARVPCPVFRTLQAATARQLDFVAITDHNTTSQNQSLAELAPYFDKLLIIPGREITTFHGHANVFGPAGPLDFQLGGKQATDLRVILDQVEAAGGLFSVNHPGLPSGEACMGCGWTASVDDPRISAVELINGGGVNPGADPLGPMSGLRFWQARLAEGRQITAIGGSDNHDAGLDPGRPQSIGYPTTVVHADELSQAGVLEAIRRGRVFIDVEGSPNRLMSVSASTLGQTVELGGVLSAPRGARVSIEVQTEMVTGAVLKLVGDLTDPGAHRSWDIVSDHQTVAFDLIADGGRGWFRFDVYGPDGGLWLVGNPVYLDGDKSTWIPRQ